jgi:hypothetical protein
LYGYKHGNHIALPKENVLERSNEMSSPSLDIFKEDLGGNPIWVDAVGDLENARRRVSQLVSVFPGEYFIFDQRTRQIVVRQGSDQIDWT